MWKKGMHPYDDVIDSDYGGLSGQGSDEDYHQGMDNDNAHYVRSPWESCSAYWASEHHVKRYMYSFNMKACFFHAVDSLAIKFSLNTYLHKMWSSVLISSP